MSSLYELNQNFQNLIEVLENTEDESLKNLIENSLDELEMDINTKIENIIKYMTNLNSDIEAYKGEIDRITKKKKVKENRVAELKAYLLDFMLHKDLKKKEVGTFTLKISNSKSVDILDENLLDERFLKTKKEIDKKSISEALKNNEIVLGAKFKENKNIQIK